MTIARIKDAAREAAYARRKAAHSAGDHCAALLDVLGDLRGRVISAYMPIRTEIDPRPAMRVLAQQNRMCVPVIIGKGQPLVFHEWSPDAAMKSGPFGAQVPVDDVALVPDVLITPLLAFDDACYRLGYGGGFYDRTLEKLRAVKPITAYGFAYDAQHMTDLPIEPTDQSLDGIVTPSGLRSPK